MLRSKVQPPGAVVCGAGGFIGGHLVKELQSRGVHVIRAVDIKPIAKWFQVTDGVENLTLDLNLEESCERAAEGACQIFNLAANMGGMGFIESNKALCMLSVLTQHPHAPGRSRIRCSTVFLLVVGLRLQRRQAARYR